MRTARTLLLITITTINGPVIAWLKRDLGLIATTGTGDGIHGAWFALAMPCPLASV